MRFPMKLKKKKKKKKKKGKEVAGKPLRFLRPLITLVKSKVGGGEIVKKSF